MGGGGGVGIRMGWAVKEVCGGARSYVVAQYSRSGLTFPFIGAVLAGTINLAMAWWLVTSIENICQDELLPQMVLGHALAIESFFDASVIWGLVGPKLIFGSDGNYAAMNWFFLGVAIGPIIVWLLHKAFPKQS